MQLSRAGQPFAKEAERGTVLVYLGVDDDHSEVQVDLRGCRPSVDVLTEAIEALVTVRDESRRLDA